MFDHPQLEALLAIVETGSFDAAAARLGLTQSAVSQRIRALEERAGGPVLRRGPPATPTQLGETLAIHAAELHRLNAQLAGKLGKPTVAMLTLAVNADSLATWFLPALQGLDPLRFRIRIEDQDHSADLVRSGEVAAAVTTRADPVQGADSIALGALRYIPTASPEFMRQHFAAGITAETLARAPALVFNAKDAIQHDWARLATGRDIRLDAHYLPSTRGFVEAARLGIGWCLNPEPLVRDDLDAGRLVALLPDLPLDTPFYWHSSRIGAGLMAPLTANVKKAAKAALIPHLSGENIPGGRA